MGYLMPRVFPSQIVEYLKAVFAENDPRRFAEFNETIGPITGFLDLFDQLPPELIVLSGNDYAVLVQSIGTIRFRTEQWRQTNDGRAMRAVPQALSEAWKLVEKLPDQVPSAPHDLSFINDPILQGMIGLDIAAVTTALQSGEWKGATIIAGSCCEALLLYGIMTKDGKTPGSVAQAVRAMGAGRKLNVSDFTDRSWDLSSYSTVAHALGLISDNTKSALHAARDYRNLIHPSKTIREAVKFDRGTALIGAGVIEHVISDLKKNL
jgi:hypothetical protein